MRRSVTFCESGPQLLKGHFEKKYPGHSKAAYGIARAKFSARSALKGYHTQASPRAELPARTCGFRGLSADLAAFAIDLGLTGMSHPSEFSPSQYPSNLYDV